MAARRAEVRCGDLVFGLRTAGPEDGEAVVLLHGFPQTSAVWSPYLARLAAAGFRAVAPDLRGYTATARPAAVGQYALEHLVADVLDLTERLGIDRFHLVGHDWGGMVGWALAAAHPGRLRSLTSVSTPHPRAYVSSLWRSSQLARSWYVAFFQVPRVPELLLGSRKGALLRRLLGHTGLPGAEVDRYAASMLRPGALRAAVNYYRALRPGRTLAVGRVRVPTLYVWSTGDVALGPVAARATERQVDGPYRFEVLQGASHWIPETCVDELGTLVVEHMRAYTGSPAA